MESRKIVTAAVIVIGNEILSGRTQDKNVAYAGKHLNERGVQLAEVRVIPDIQSRIVDTVNELRKSYDYVFTTGGIGPTHDDITSESIAAAFGLDWDFHPEAYKILEAYYERGAFTTARQKMAKTPVGASLIPNPVSGAPGFVVENVYVMAGIPNIMQAMLDSVLPTLVGGGQLLSQTIVCHLPESKIAEALGDVQKQYPDSDIGSYPRYENGAFVTSLVVRAFDSEILKNATQGVTSMIEAMGASPIVIEKSEA